MGELHCTNMIFRRQLITAATAIITLTVLLASTDAAHIEDTVVPESTDSVRLVEETDGGWQFTQNVCKQHGLSIVLEGATCDWGNCDASRGQTICDKGKCTCKPGRIPDTNNVWCGDWRGNKCEQQEIRDAEDPHAMIEYALS